MKVSQNFHKRKYRHDNKTAEAIWKMKCSYIRPATLTEHYKNAVGVVPTVRNSWIDEISHRREEHCSIFMITCQGQAATPGLPFASGSESMNRFAVLCNLFHHFFYLCIINTQKLRWSCSHVRVIILSFRTFFIKKLINSIIWLILHMSHHHQKQSSSKICRTFLRHRVRFWFMGTWLIRIRNITAICSDRPSV